MAYLMDQDSVSARAKNEDDDQSISLKDILQFLKEAWKVTLLCAIFGFLAGLGYILVTPNLYESVAQIKMAQISIANPANPFGTPVEDPASLIARMQMPTNFTSAMTSACGYQNTPQAALKLSKMLKISIPKGLINTVELRVISESPQIAQACAQAVFDRISILQMEFAKPFVLEAKLKLAQDNERIEIARKLIAKADKSGSAMSAAYLSARDEITYFMTDREKMLDLINSVQHRGTKMISPIYTQENPVAPKKKISLLVGLLAGVLSGLGISLARRFFTSIRKKMSV